MSDKTQKDIVNQVLSEGMVREVWSINYPDAIAFTLQYFTVGALLPAVMYMFRRGYRRGSGGFAATFAPLSNESEVNIVKRASPSAASVARVLASDEEGRHFRGFSSKVGQDILSDMLLVHCLENQKHAPGRRKQVIRAFPTHYLAAWIDLPEPVSQLRLVPESLVCMLADQKSGESIDGTHSHKTWFPVRSDFSENLLLNTFGQGMKARQAGSDLVDDFDESQILAIDQLLTARIAKACKAAPKKIQIRSGSHRHFAEGRGTPEIANQHPIASTAARHFNEDFRLFLQAYGKTVPRQTLIQTLDSCISLGLTNILLSTALNLFEWEVSGEIPKEQSSWPVFVDCSNTSDNELRRIAEESMDDCLRRLRRLPVILMALRIAEYEARAEIGKELPPRRPDATARINALGQIVRGSHQISSDITRAIRKHCNRLSESLRSAEVALDACDILEDEIAIENPIWRLAESLTLMMGDKLQAEYVLKCLDCCMMQDEKHGLSTQRRVVFQTMRNGKKSGMMKSVVLTDTMLDFLVHRHLRKPGKGGNTKPNPLSFNDFVTLLRVRYGLLVDQSPPGQTISRELLQRNRRFLERRLRSLGLLMGVNDAESMKRLRPRFNAREEGEN